MKFDKVVNETEYLKKYDKLTDIKKKSQKPQETVITKDKNKKLKNSYPSPMPWDTQISQKGYN